MLLKLLAAFIGFIPLVNGMQISFSRWYTDVAFNDVMPTSGYQPDVTNARSLQECGYLCGLNCGQPCGKECACMSFFYSRNTSVCQLHHAVLNTITGLNTVPSSQYYIRKVPAFTCPEDDTIYRTTTLADGSLFIYKVYRTQKVMQSDAHSQCIADGAHLVRLTSDFKVGVLSELLGTCPGNSGNSWVDLTNVNAIDFNDVNQWVSSVGSALGTCNNLWKPGQPDDPTKHHCALLCGRVYSQLCDRSCERLSNYICEKTSQ